MSEEDSNVQDQLKELLEQGGKWARLATSVPGLNIVKLPGHKSRPARLALEINPIIPSVGKPQKKSLFITTEEQYEEYTKLFQEQIGGNIIKHIEEINGEAKEKRHKDKFIGKLDLD